MRKIKNGKGITLIALVVTIVVLLILAGTSISILSGDNGIMSQAQKSQKETLKAEEEEKIRLAYNTIKIQKSTQGNTNEITITEIKTELEKNGETIDVTGDDTFTLTMPSGNQYTLTQTGTIESIGNTENEDDNTSGAGVAEVDGLKWIYVENEDGNIEITGLDLNEYESKRYDSYRRSISIGKETLTVPSTINGKTVVKFDWKDTVMPTDIETYNLAFDDVKKLVYADTIEEIANNYPNKDVCFVSVEEINLPDNLKILGDWACTACFALKNITIPTSTNSIGYRAFFNCYALESMIIPGNVISIENNAFLNCQGLQSVEISEGTALIEEDAFCWCKNLTTITLPTTITSIDNYAFSGCNKLSTINYRGTSEEWSKISIGENNYELSNAEVVFNYSE